HLTLDGFLLGVTQGNPAKGVTGIKIGAHDGGGSVVGVLVQNNVVKNFLKDGIQVTAGLNIEIAFNKIFGNGANGINYSGTASLIHDNEVYNNQQFGIYVKDGEGHQVFNNNAHDNLQ